MTDKYHPTMSPEMVKTHESLAGKATQQIVSIRAKGADIPVVLHLLETVTCAVLITISAPGNERKVMADFFDRVRHRMGEVLLMDVRSEDDGS